MSHQPELLSGTCERLLFSPKGSIEGLLLKSKTQTVQISMPPQIGDAMVKKAAPGKRLRLLATPDHSPKKESAVHAVYEFEALADADGNALETTDGTTTLKGVVASIHYAKHGEPNGVILETGEFVHLRPHGMQAIGLEIGSKVNATGTTRMTVLGTTLLEASRVNRVDIE